MWARAVCWWTNIHSRARPTMKGLRRALSPNTCGNLGLYNWSATSGSSTAPDGATRTLSVLAWGRNVEGQCGVELSPLVLRPTTLLDVYALDTLQTVVAGKLTSAAVLNNGEVMTWGCGKSGKLGHGSAHGVRSPARVEWFVGRTSIAAAALGDQHSLFLDATGGVWSCGENKEGQCGFGTPVELLAQQYRQAYHQSIRPSPMAQLQEAAFRQQQQEDDMYVRYLKSVAQQPAGHVAWGWGTLRGHYHHPRPPAITQGASANSSSTSSSWTADISSSGLWGIDLDTHLSESGLQPGQVHTPSRVGQPSHYWTPPEAESAFDSDASTSSSSSSSSAAASSSSSRARGPAAAGVPQQPALAGKAVVSVAASKYFSAAVTSEGQLWTWGADYNGALGSHLSWSTAATPVGGTLAALLADMGGAVSVVAGSGFAACLTAAGKVLIWGKLAAACNSSSTSSSSGLSSKGPQFVEVVEGLPAITSIAAGSQHLLLSDGERVWGVGRWLDRNGSEAGAATWASPAELLQLPAAGVGKLAAGPHSSAVVSGDGQLYLWGRLLEQHHAERVLRNAGADAPPEHINSDWVGFGGAKPAVVEGLAGVRDVALGGWHALVLVE